MTRNTSIFVLFTALLCGAKDQGCGGEVSGDLAVNDEGAGPAAAGETDLDSPPVARAPAMSCDYAAVVAECHEARASCAKMAQSAWGYAECPRRAADCFYQSGLTVHGDQAMCEAQHALEVVHNLVDPTYRVRTWCGPY